MHILKDVLPIHNSNVNDIRYLRNEYKGKQHIYEKHKQIRKEINHKVVENHLRHAVSFKKSYAFGDPIQYVTKIHEADDIPNENGDEPDVTRDLSVLNTLFSNTNKGTLDIDLADEIYVSGVCPRMLKVTDEGFDLHNLNPEHAAVVYSTNIGNEPLFSFYKTVKKDYVKDESLVHITVHTAKNIYLFTTPESNYIKGMDSLPTFVKRSVKEEANVLGHIPIVEYTFNKDRVSIVETMLPSQNLLNQITSNEIDDIEQFVEQLLVITNAELAEGSENFRDMGIIELKDTANFKASIEILANKMDNSSIKTYYDRVYEIMMINVGVPLVNAGGGGGDTGLARLTDNGWLMADTKVKEDELGFIQSEKPLLKAVIELIKRKKLITKLDITHVDTKFTRNKTDNILTKIQALQSAVGVMAPKDAFTVSGIFNDPEQAYNNAKEFYGDTFFNKETKQTSNLNNEVAQTISDDPQEQE